MKWFAFVFAFMLFPQYLFANEEDVNEVELKWSWSESTYMPAFNQIMATPVVAQLNDDNGDGVIDNKDTSDVVIITFSDDNYTQGGIVRALNGRDGTELWAYENGGVIADARYSPAVGDIDGDGVAEIVVSSASQGVINVLDHNGVIQKQIGQVESSWRSVANIALFDINQDGFLEILAADGVYDYRSERALFNYEWSPSPIGVPNNEFEHHQVFANGTLYDVNGNVVWHHDAEDTIWFASFANLDQDQYPEIFMSVPANASSPEKSSIVVLEHDGVVKWQMSDENNPGGGAQAVSRFLGDDIEGASSLGIAYASYDSINMYNSSGELIWSVENDDFGSGKIGVSAFDFDNDGTDELLTQSHSEVRVLDGKTGEVLWAIDNSSSTLWEYPIVVDLEGDDNAELIVVANNYDSKYNINNGVFVYNSSSDDFPWKNASRIWNQHSFNLISITQLGMATSLKQIGSSPNSYRSSSLPKDNGVPFGVQVGSYYHQNNAFDRFSPQPIERHIVSSHSAFAHLKNDGTVDTWGEASGGGDSDSASIELQDVKSISATGYAFAALKADGTVVTWGNPVYGGNSEKVQAELKNVIEIHSSSGAFAALKDDGTVVAWGNTANGGDASSVQSDLTTVRTIYSTFSSFAALKEDGSVVTWGSPTGGGDSDAVRAELTSVKYIYATYDAFAALKDDGTVVTWGSAISGGNSTSVLDQLFDVESIHATKQSFAALKKDGSVVTWGNRVYGGDSGAVQNLLTGVKSIVGTDAAFAAIKDDSTVVTWGVSDQGGDSSEVEDRLNDVIAVYPNGLSFAALKKDGTVVSWGHRNYGGDSLSVQGLLNSVENIFSTSGAFAALKEDGSVVTWGHDLYGGNSVPVQRDLQQINHIYSNNSTFSALRKDGEVVTWGQFPNMKWGLRALR